MKKCKKKFKKITIALSTFACILAILAFVIWLNYDKILWAETVKLMNQVFKMDIESWDFEYKYENKLERFRLRGHLLVQLTTTPEKAEELLVDYKDRLLDDEELEIYEKRTVARRFNMNPEQVNGKTAFVGNSVVRKIPFQSSLRSRNHCIHMQENADGTVTVYFYYNEGYIYKR